MTQPDYVPRKSGDSVRRTEHLPPADSKTESRPARIETLHQPSGAQLGSPGPDQGYGLKLAKHYSGKLQLSEGEHEKDVIAGCLGVALKRASLYGRAPVIYDFEFAYTLWGYLGDAPADLVSGRRHLFEQASHHYEDQRQIADSVPEGTLRLTPDQVRDQLGSWKTLIHI